MEVVRGGSSGMGRVVGVDVVVLIEVGEDKRGAVSGIERQGVGMFTTEGETMYSKNFSWFNRRGILWTNIN